MSTGIIASSNRRLDPDATVYINALKAQGYTASETEVLAINKLVKNLKATGPQNSSVNFWTTNDVYRFWPCIGNSKACCEVELRLNSGGVFSGTGWTYNSTGAISNGTGSSHFKTGVTPTNLGVNAGFGVYNRSFATGWILGGRGSSPFFALESVNSSSLGCLFNASTTASESRVGAKNLIGGRVSDADIVRPAAGVTVANAKADPGTNEIIFGGLTTASGFHAIDAGYFMLNSNFSSAKRTILKSITDQFVADLSRT